MTRPPSPPRLAAWLAGLRIDPAEREFALGDLEEDFRAMAASRGPRAARRWYWRQAIKWGQTPFFNWGPSPFFAWRAVRRAPAASAAAILTYALGIGANIAIVSVAWPVLVAPLPFPAEQQLVELWLTVEQKSGGVGTNPISVGDYNDMRTATAFAATAAFSDSLSQMNLATGAEPRQIAVAHVTPAFFTVLGVQPLHGRTFLPSDDGTGHALLVLSARTWQTMFGGDPGVVGRVVRLDGEPIEIVGIVPSTAGLGTHDADAWTVMTLPASRARQRAYFLRAIARLRPGVSREAANDELAAIMARAAEEFPESNRIISAQAFSFREAITGPSRESLLALVFGAALLLLVAGINLAGLLAARTVQRAREISIRRALGASRGRIWWQLVFEQLLVACAGGLAGLAAAALTLRAVIGLAPEGAWHPDRALPLAAVLALALGLALVMGLLVAAVPAWRASASSRPLQSHTRGASGTRAAARGRAAVIAAQVALTVLLLVVATLVGTSLARVLDIDPGFRAGGRLVADISLPWARYDDAVARAAFFEGLLARARELPGVDNACAINEMPLENEGGMTWVAFGTTRMVLATHKSASAGCFDVLGVPLVRGRLPRTPESEPVMLLSESMAAALWADGRDPIGERVHMGLAGGRLMTVIGVVGDMHNVSLERDSRRQVWMPHDLGYFPPRRVAVRMSRAGVAPASIAPPLRAILRELDPDLALANVRTIDDIVVRATAGRRFVLWLLGGFAAIALVLAAVGIYGVLAHLVGQRTQEIGIRRALGAQTPHITRVIAGTVGAAIAAGTAAGLAAAWGVSSLVASLLYEMSATDARVYAAVALFVGAVAALAAWPPARRAARVEPMRALRN